MKIFGKLGGLKLFFFFFSCQAAPRFASFLLITTATYSNLQTSGTRDSWSFERRSFCSRPQSSKSGFSKQPPVKSFQFPSSSSLFIFQHAFNAPYQLAKTDEPNHISDGPEKSSLSEMKLQTGDTLVVGTDGLFDNMLPEEIIDFLQPHIEEAKKAVANLDYLEAEATLNRASASLVSTAMQLALQKRRVSPFAANASAHYGSRILGGLEQVSLSPKS